jgi:hypothetical protein
MGQMRALVLTTTVFAASLLGSPQQSAACPPMAPPENGVEAPKTKHDTPVSPEVEPEVELTLANGELNYTYDIRDIFDDALWAVLKKNGYSEITVEVRLLDAVDAVRTTQFHQLKIELLDSGRVRVMTTPRRGRIYKNRAAMVTALGRLPGRPMAAGDFAGTSGHLELVVLVNPVKVYSFPENDSEMAEQRVVPKTYYDRKLELRSATVDEANRNNAETSP